MREFAMGAVVPVTFFDPMLTLELLMWVWLIAGMLFASLGLMLNRDSLGGKSASQIVAAWCVVSIVSPAVLLWRACKGSNDNEEDK